MTLLQDVQAIPWWYHKIKLPGGLVTPGWAPMDPATYRFPESFEGQRVLDVGAWDGYWSFEALKRGAKEVVAIDDFSDIKDRLDLAKHKPWCTFDICRKALGYDEAVCHRHDMTVYDLTPETFGQFDTVLAYGLLYHCRYPMLAMDAMAAVCASTLLIETAILDDYSAYQGHGYPGPQIVAEFYPENQYGNNASNWWVPTMACLGMWARAAGFRGFSGWKLNHPAADLWFRRGFLRATK